MELPQVRRSSIVAPDFLNILLLITFAAVEYAVPVNTDGQNVRIALAVSNSITKPLALVREHR